MSIAENSKIMKTIFCDIDGTLLRFREDFGSMMNYAEPLRGVVQTTMHWHKNGYKVILVTGRPEPFRKRTEDQLQRFGIIYDQLVMGVGSGPRYLINDTTPQGEQTAYSINMVRNEGLSPDILEEDKKEKSKPIRSAPEIEDQMLSCMGEYVTISKEKEDKYNKIPTKFH